MIGHVFLSLSCKSFEVALNLKNYSTVVSCRSILFTIKILKHFKFQTRQIKNDTRWSVHTSLVQTVSNRNEWRIINDILDRTSSNRALYFTALNMKMGIPRSYVRACKGKCNWPCSCFYRAVNCRVALCICKSNIKMHI